MFRIILLPHRVITIKIKHAPLLANLLIKRLGIHAVVTPWRVIYVARGSLSDDNLIQQKLIRARQIERDGRVGFCVRWLWLNTRHGFARNPYEAEMRKRAANPSSTQR